MRIGVDFGTTHTSAALYKDNQLQFIPLDSANRNPHILRSMIYIDQEYRHRVGLDAVQTFLAEDTGRPVVYAEKVVGVIENTVASLGRDPITIIYDTIIDEDIGARGRLLQSIKTGLRSAWYEGTTIFGKAYTIQELIALLLSHVRTAAEATLKTDVDEAMLGRPVRFTGDPEDDRLAEQRLREAAQLAGFNKVTFSHEPIAAALFYLNEAQTPETLLVFDFGGGTLDLTVIRSNVDTEGSTDKANYEILASQGVLIGGDDLDSAIMNHQVAPYFGTRSKIDVDYDGREMYLPEGMARNLYRWQTIPMLSRPDPLEVIERAKRYGDNKEAFAALESLVTQNYGFALFEKIEQAKRILSSERQATLQMAAEVINLDITIPRREFNLAIGDEMADIRSAVREVIRASGVEKSEIDVVVTTGGSSAIPIFQMMLKREFPDAHFVESDIFGSVTGGLAIMATEGQ